MSAESRVLIFDPDVCGWQMISEKRLLLRTSCIMSNCPPKILALVFVKTAVIGSVLSDAGAVPSGKRLKNVHALMPHGVRLGFVSVFKRF